MSRRGLSTRPNEQLKASEQLGWISRMNSIRQQAEKTVLANDRQIRFIMGNHGEDLLYQRF